MTVTCGCFSCVVLVLFLFRSLHLRPLGRRHNEGSGIKNGLSYYKQRVYFGPAVQMFRSNAAPFPFVLRGSTYDKFNPFILPLNKRREIKKMLKME